MLYWTYMKPKKRYEAHGMSNTPFYNRWRGMMRRCYNKKFKQFDNYGGRGIQVCDRWHLFSNFKEDMYESFDIKLELDRTDNNGDYSPDNCTWVSHYENSRNRTTTRFYKGETATEASLRIAGNTNIVSSRLRKGWGIEKAFTTPKDHKQDRVTKVGENS